MNLAPQDSRVWVILFVGLSQGSRQNQIGYTRPSWRSGHLSNSLRNLELTIERVFNAFRVPGSGAVKVQGESQH